MVRSIEEDDGHMNDIEWMKLYNETLAKMRKVNGLLDKARENHEIAEGLKKAA